MPNSNRQNNGNSALKTAATFGIGAVVGAVVAGAVWFFNSEEEERSHTHRQQSHAPTYQPGHPANRSFSDSGDQGPTVKACEICFSLFDELKEANVAIVTTPCGHIYCKDCITGALAVKPECPHCRAEVRVNDLTRLFM